MTVTAVAELADGLYTPFVTKFRGGPDGSQPVGTLAVQVVATGDGSGGVINMRITGTRSAFGFRYTWIPLYLLAGDTDQAVAKIYTLSWLNLGNIRLNAGLIESLPGVADAQELNAGPFASAGVQIEVESATALNILQMTASVNTTGASYRFRTYGPVYDRELIARHGVIDELFTGVR